MRHKGKRKRKYRHKILYQPKKKNDLAYQIQGNKGKWYAVKSVDGKIVNYITPNFIAFERMVNYHKAVSKSCNSLEEAKRYLGLVDFKSKIGPEIAVAYVDGTYDRELGMYGSGIYICHNDKEIEIKKSGSDETMVASRHIAGEINAAMIAMNFAIEKGVKKLVLYYDFKGLWTLAMGFVDPHVPTTIKYVNFCEKALRKLDVEFRHVTSHSGNIGNVHADALAKAALAEVRGYDYKPEESRYDEYDFTDVDDIEEEDFEEASLFEYEEDDDDAEYEDNEYEEDDEYGDDEDYDEETEYEDFEEDIPVAIEYDEEDEEHDHCEEYDEDEEEEDISDRYIEIDDEYDDDQYDEYDEYGDTPQFRGILPIEYVVLDKKELRELSREDILLRE